LPLKFKQPDYHRLKKSKGELYKLVKQHIPHLEIDTVYSEIDRAFGRAAVSLALNRVERTGPTAAQRKLLAKQIGELSHKLLFALTGASKPSRTTNLGGVQRHLFHIARQFLAAKAAQEAIPILVHLESAAARIAKLNEQTIGGATPPPNSTSRGRPTNEARNILFSELMRAWEKLTGERPTLSRNADEGVTCRFCLFFHHYFGGDDASLKARAIADRCAKLVNTP
jgi:hypothetical protein